jgi:hypothetical protein
MFGNAISHSLRAEAAASMFAAEERLLPIGMRDILTLYRGRGRLNNITAVCVAATVYKHMPAFPVS